MAIPNSQTFLINDNIMGKVIETEPKDLQNSFVRVVENGIILNYQSAKEVHRWLGELLKSLESVDSGK